MNVGNGALSRTTIILTEQLCNACDFSLDISRRGTQQHSSEMSSEGENGKNPTAEPAEAVKAEEANEASDKPDQDPKPEETKTIEKEEEKKEPAAKEEKTNDKVEESKKEEKDEKKPDKNESKDEPESEDPEDSDKDEDSNEKTEESSPEKNTAKDKKSNQKNNDENKDGKIEIPEGSGTQLGEIPRIHASISRFKNDDLKLLHKLLFKMPGKTLQLKKNIRKFKGFDFKRDSDDYKKKLTAIEKFELKQLRIICEMLDLEKKGNKDEVSERILDFLIEPKDSGKAVGGGRPKRTAAVKANNRGYSSHDESYSSDEKTTPRARRNAGKRANLKDETSSESDEEFKPSDASEEERPAVKRKRVGRKKKDDSEEDDASEVDSQNSSDDSDDGPKNKKKKIVNSKVKPKAGPGRGRGRKPAVSPAAATPKKKTPAKRGRKKAQQSSEEEEESAHEDEGSSSEDEPLVKKTAKAPQPPSDEEIKTYVKEILEGANLEEITMKTVCKQVYAHYPDFDLTHKKDYIKTTVKSLIST